MNAESNPLAVKISKSSRNVSYLFATLILIVLAIAWFGEQTINWPGLFIVLFFYLIIFGIGIWSGQKGDNEDENSFLLAGRKMPLWIAMITMAATWIGGGFINGTILR